MLFRIWGSLLTTREFEKFNLETSTNGRWLMSALVPKVFSNSGFRCQALRDHACRAHCVSAVGACPPHDGVKRRWWINVASAVSPIESSQKIGQSHHRHRPGRDVFSRRAAGTL